MTRKKVNLNGSRTVPTTMLSRQKVKAWLRLASIALLFFYIYNIYKIADKKAQIYAASSMSEMMAPSTANPSPPARYNVTTTYTSSCVSTVLYYYLSASLLWNIIIFSTKKRRKHYLLGSIICLIVTINLQFNNGHCKPSVESERTDGASPNSNTQHIITTRSDGSSWKGNNVRISFRLHDPDEVTSPDTFSKVNYRCADRPNLPPSLAKRTVLNFSTSVRTDLNVAFMGDSIGAQFAQAFDAAALGEGNEGRRWAQSYRYKPDKDWISECLTISAPVRGGGVSAFWRMTGLMSMMNKKTSIYHCDRDHHNDKGWGENQAVILLDHPMSNHTEASENHDRKAPSVGAYDAFVMRVPHGWLAIDQITKEGIIEQINLNNRYLGAQTVIISTLPLCNNVVTPNHWKKIGEINQMIRDIARNWPSSSSKVGENNGIRTVLVQEFSNYTSQVIWSNAKHIGLYNGSMPDFAQNGWEQTGDFLFDRLSISGKWPPSKAQVCVSRKFWVNDHGEQCHLNRISVDGSHWCVNSLGPRHSASIACLLGCVFNGENNKAMEEIRECEQKCNDQFMSIVP
eukprot:CAMPEP_0172318500 /NCGR_PEP_ID=MMETSP1058-20130122/35066_1 /TAXON_ID=83371 /ORGANISM="Detonula confervacea, Strain CCMP 353" /LENGTH=569 /DNA_ID=CAMNT_0013033349 /DNA_START=6 /DNA_END=1711 /DNA_ORIENTATION=+